MSTVLDLLGIVAFIVCTISVAAAMTYVVVKVTPAKQSTSGGGTKPQP